MTKKSHRLTTWYAVYSKTKQREYYYNPEVRLFPSSVCQSDQRYQVSNPSDDFLLPHPFPILKTKESTWILPDDAHPLPLDCLYNTTDEVDENENFYGEEEVDQVVQDTFVPRWIRVQRRKLLRQKPDVVAATLVGLFILLAILFTPIVRQYSLERPQFVSEKLDWFYQTYKDIISNNLQTNETIPEDLEDDGPEKPEPDHQHFPEDTEHSDKFDFEPTKDYVIESEQDLIGNDSSMAEKGALEEEDENKETPEQSDEAQLETSDEESRIDIKGVEHTAKIDASDQSTTDTNADLPTSDEEADWNIVEQDGGVLVAAGENEENEALEVELDALHEQLRNELPLEDPDYIDEAESGEVERALQNDITDLEESSAFSPEELQDAEASSSGTRELQKELQELHSNDIYENAEAESAVKEMEDDIISSERVIDNRENVPATAESEEDSRAFASEENIEEDVSIASDTADAESKQTENTPVPESAMPDESDRGERKPMEENEVSMPPTESISELISHPTQLGEAMLENLEKFLEHEYGFVVAQNENGAVLLEKPKSIVQKNQDKHICSIPFSNIFSRECRRQRNRKN